MSANQSGLRHDQTRFPIQCLRCYMCLTRLSPYNAVITAQMRLLAGHESATKGRRTRPTCDENAAVILQLGQLGLCGRHLLHLTPVPVASRIILTTIWRLSELGMINSDTFWPIMS